ncbi:MAG: hypothetical protein QOH46_547, partial [Solirubrobacteraceae bacterium]|nr:hypothetical protein [Solirubrobacteraceae bacterium]
MEAGTLAGGRMTARAHPRVRAGRHPAAGESSCLHRNA